MSTSKSNIEQLLLELCAEDDWGSWELWWNISGSMPHKPWPEPKHAFLDVIDGLVAEGRLLAKHRLQDGSFAKTGYQRATLAFEIEHADAPDPDNFYWFGVR